MTAPIPVTILTGVLGRNWPREIIEQGLCQDLRSCVVVENRGCLCEIAESWRMCYNRFIMRECRLA